MLKRLAPFRTPWLALFLAVSLISLIFQLFPSSGVATWNALDYRNWSPRTWVGLNIIVLSILLASRVSSQIRDRARQCRQEHVRGTPINKDNPEHGTRR